MLELASEPQRSFSKQSGGREDESELNGGMTTCTDSSEYTDEALFFHLTSPVLPPNQTERDPPRKLWGPTILSLIR